MVVIHRNYQYSNFIVSSTHGEIVRVRSLSPTESRIVLSLEAEGKVELTLDELERRAGVRRGFARKLAHDLIAKRWLERVAPGRYLLNPSRRGPEAIPDTDPLRIGARLVRPYYLGYGTAAELWGLLLQAGQVYYVVTTRRIATHPKHVARFRFVRVRPGRFFGRTTRTRRGETISVSDRERTLLDCAQRPDLAGGMGGVAQIAARALPGLDWARLSRYLDRFGERSRARRLGYLLEAVTPTSRLPSDWVRRWSARPADPWTFLGPPRSFGRHGPRDRRWHVVRNVPDTVLFAEVGRS